MTKLLLLVAPLLGVSEVVTIESLRLVGTTIAALASVYVAWSARQGKARRRRRLRRRRNGEPPRIEDAE